MRIEDRGLRIEDRAAILAAHRFYLLLPALAMRFACEAITDRVMSAWVGACRHAEKFAEFIRKETEDARELLKTSGAKRE